MANPEPPPLGERLRLALDESPLSIRELARRLAGPEASESRVEAVRRSLGRYLAGQSKPRRATADRIAAELGKPAGFLYDALPERVALADQLREFGSLIGELGDHLERTRDVEIREALQSIDSRLERLASAVRDLAKGQAALLERREVEPGQRRVRPKQTK